MFRDFVVAMATDAASILDDVRNLEAQYNASSMSQSIDESNANFILNLGSPRGPVPSKLCDLHYSLYHPKLDSSSLESRKRMGTLTHPPFFPALKTVI